MLIENYFLGITSSVFYSYFRTSCIAKKMDKKVAPDWD